MFPGIPTPGPWRRTAPLPPFEDDIGGFWIAVGPLLLIAGRPLLVFAPVRRAPRGQGGAAGQGRRPDRRRACRSNIIPAVPRAAPRASRLKFTDDPAERKADGSPEPILLDVRPQPPGLAGRAPRFCVSMSIRDCRRSCRGRTDQFGVSAGSSSMPEFSSPSSSRRRCRRRSAADSVGDARPVLADGARRQEPRLAAALACE